MSSHIKKLKPVPVSMYRVAITNLNVKVWIRKSDYPQWNFLHHFNQPEIIRQIPFKLADIEYDLIKDEIKRMEPVEYNSSAVRNLINVNDIEEFANV